MKMNENVQCECVCGWSDKLIITELLITHAHEYYPVYIIL